MQNGYRTGFFGKLPTYGDFIQRNLPNHFIEAWDDWLQHLIAVSQEQLSDRWLEIYLTSPIWRFVLSNGAIDSAVWAGILIPSVDRVGRYFPFTIVRKLPSEVNSALFLSVKSAWYKDMEELALLSLDGELQIEEIVERLERLDDGIAEIYMGNGHAHAANLFHANIDEEDQEQTAIHCLFNMIMQKSHSSYSMWETCGSSIVAPCLICSQGLPPVSGVTAMLDGEWDSRGWNQTCGMKNSKYSVIV